MHTQHIHTHSRSIAVLALLEDEQLLRSERAAAAARAAASPGALTGFSWEQATAAAGNGQGGDYGGGYGGDTGWGTTGGYTGGGYGGGCGGGYGGGGGGWSKGGFYYGSSGFSKLMSQTGGDAADAGRPAPQLPAPAPRRPGDEPRPGAAGGAGAGAWAPTRPPQGGTTAAGAGERAVGGGGGFGEAKGVSFEENQKHLAALRQLLQRPENRRCADCQEAGPAAAPSWASINLGVFVCLQCAGLHRGLGVHVSKVRARAVRRGAALRPGPLLDATRSCLPAHATFTARGPPPAPTHTLSPAHPPGAILHAGHVAPLPSGLHGRDRQRRGQRAF